MGGPCTIESDILFLTDGREEKMGTGKMGYFAALKKLPKWDQTTLWCRSLALQSVNLPERMVTPRTLSKAPLQPRGRQSDRKRRSRMSSSLFALADFTKLRQPAEGLAKRIHEIGNNWIRMLRSKGRR